MGGLSRSSTLNEIWCGSIRPSNSEVEIYPFRVSAYGRVAGHSLQRYHLINQVHSSHQGGALGVRLIESRLGNFCQPREGTEKTKKGEPTGGALPSLPASHRASRKAKSTLQVSHTEPRFIEMVQHVFHGTKIRGPDRLLDFCSIDSVEVATFATHRAGRHLGGVLQFRTVWSTVGVGSLFDGHIVRIADRTLKLSHGFFSSLPDGRITISLSLLARRNARGLGCSFFFNDLISHSPRGFLMNAM